MTNDIRDKMAKKRCDNPDECGRNASCCILCRDFKDGFDSGAAHQKKVDEEKIDNLEKVVDMLNLVKKDYSKVINEYLNSYRPDQPISPWDAGLILKQHALLIERGRESLKSQLQSMTEKAQRYEAALNFYADPETWLIRNKDSWKKGVPQSDEEMILNYLHPETDWVGTITVLGKKARNALRFVEQGE